MVNEKNPKYKKFVKAWSFPYELEKLIGSLIEGKSLHICCGASELGDVRFDLYPEAATGANFRGSMFNLPFKNGSFDTVICDPPWHLSYDVRFSLMFQIRDVLKHGGLLLFNGPWFPKVRGLDIAPQIYVGIPSIPSINVSLLFLARRSSLDGYQVELAPTQEILAS